VDSGQEGPFMIGVFYLLVSASRSYKRAIRNFIFEQQKGSVSVPGMHSQLQRKKKVKWGWDATHNTKGLQLTQMTGKKRKTTRDVLSA
jgi:hypothetical protein